MFDRGLTGVIGLIAWLWRAVLGREVGHGDRGAGLLERWLDWVAEKIELR